MPTCSRRMQEWNDETMQMSAWQATSNVFRFPVVGSLIIEDTRFLACAIGTRTGKWTDTTPMDLCSSTRKPSWEGAVMRDDKALLIHIEESNGVALMWSEFRQEQENYHASVPRV